jgi:hypothetical protein
MCHCPSSRSSVRAVCLSECELHLCNHLEESSQVQSRARDRHCDLHLLADDLHPLQISHEYGLFSPSLDLPVLSLALSVSPLLSVITDWNDDHAASHRVRYNYNTPCYFDAFPPYTKDLSKGNCPNYDSVSSELPSRNQGDDISLDTPSWPNLAVSCNPLSVGFYDDANILPCDTLLGISIYTLSFIVTPLFIAIFVWFISRIIETATNQLVSSRWYDAVASIVQKYTLEKTHFEVRRVSAPLLTLTLTLTCSFLPLLASRKTSPSPRDCSIPSNWKSAHKRSTSKMCCIGSSSLSSLFSSIRSNTLSSYLCTCWSLPSSSI